MSETKFCPDCGKPLARHKTGHWKIKWLCLNPDCKLIEGHTRGYAQKWTRWKREAEAILEVTP